MRFANTKRWTAAGVLALASGCGLAAFLSADEPKDPAATRQTQEDVTMRSGTVKEFLKNDHDDVDGLRLEDDSEVRFPPHIGREVERAAKIGDEVKVEGRKKTRPRGEVVFEATNITAGGRSIKVDRPEPPRGPKGRHADDTPMNATGTVKEMHVNRHGDVDGFLLADDTEVKVPPHQGDELSGLVGKGDQVRIEGRRHETPHGDIHLHADRITAVASGKTFERDEPAGPKPEPRKGGRGPKGHGPKDELADRGPTNEEIMRELRDLRRLIEDRK